VILTRTPLRVSFVGGGSDLPAFFGRRYGAVVSATIDLHTSTLVQEARVPSVSISVAGRAEQVTAVDDISHPLVRESMRLLGVSALQVASVSAVPPGTGLGSSSAFTVSLLHAIHALRGHRPGPEQLAREACEVEIGRVGEPIGKQDQYAAAYGGLNFIRFEPDGSVHAAAVTGLDTIRRLQDRLMLVYLGSPRMARTILRGQGEGMAVPSRFRLVEEMVRLAELFRDGLQQGRLDQLGALLHEAWMRKREVHPGIATALVDDCYERARRSGAEGGKLLGAGGGGFLLIYAEPERHPAVRASLHGLPTLPIRFTMQGSAVALHAQPGL
jgi:D-glycero-alpha-D-manno-heptose-7-phosphate kinase